MTILRDQHRSRHRPDIGRGQVCRRIARLAFAALTLGCTGLFIAPQAEASAISELCDAAAKRAARETGVPETVLLAITRTETGRNRAGRLAPWPWTVNMGGTGHWFDTRQAAQAFVDRKLLNGAKSFDIGCFQINHKWHGAAFGTAGQMFEPLANARYAAAFLARLHAELGDWSRAAGAYHSRTETLARRYRARFDRIIATVSEEAPDPSPPRVRRLASVTQRRPLPLLPGSGVPARNGSLVPLGRGRAALIPLEGGF